MFNLIKTLYQKFDILIIVSSIILLMLLVGYFQYKTISSQRERIDILTTNIKAYEYEISANNGKNIEFYKTIDELNYSKDSILQKLNAERKKYKIKDKELKAIQYISTVIHDTLKVHVKSFNDTCIVFKKHPLTIINVCKKDTTITCIPVIYNEQSVFFKSKKEYVNTYSYFVTRIWKLDFRKHIVCYIDVKNTNPDVKVTNSKFVKIIE